MRKMLTVDHTRTVWYFEMLIVLVVALLLLSGCAGSRTSESTGEYVDDSVITTKVKAAITNEMGVGAAASINVETFKGVVQLSGFADSEANRSQAAAIAGSVNGVTRVENKVSIK